jgi:dihydroxyacetone kinase DhaKLM complex PTS-EIIA-like component DhaM
MKKETAKKRMNAMKDANPMYAMKDAGMEMMNAMKKVQMNDKKKIQATYEKYLPTKEGSLEAAVLKSVSTKKTD